MENINTEKSGKIKLTTSRTFARAFGIILPLSLLSLFIAAAVISLSNDMYAFVKPDNEVALSFQGGYEIGEIASLLEENGVIENSFAFEAYVRLKSKTAEVEEFKGELIFNSNMSYREILRSFL